MRRLLTVVGWCAALIPVVAGIALAQETLTEQARPLAEIELKAPGGGTLKVVRLASNPNPVRLIPQTAEIEPVDPSAFVGFQTPEKPHEVLFLSLTVYERKVTEIRWYEDGHCFRAFSNIDFNYFCGVGDFETAAATYTLFFGLGNETLAPVVAPDGRVVWQGGKWKEVWKDVPLPEDFSGERSEYMVVEDAAAGKPSEKLLAALEALHVYFDLNKQQLIEEYHLRVASDEARRKWLKEHPPAPKDIVVKFWVETPIRSTPVERRTEP